jgi:hypothetical protein
MKKFRSKQNRSVGAGPRDEAGVFAILWIDRSNEQTYRDVRGAYMELRVEIRIASNCTVTLSGGSDAV